MDKIYLLFWIVDFEKDWWAMTGEQCPVRKGLQVRQLLMAYYVQFEKCDL